MYVFALDRNGAYVAFGGNPATGGVQTKMSFVQQVDDVFVGCGVYKNLVTS